MTPNRGMGPASRAFCQITLTSCLSTGAKVPQERKLKGTKVVCGAKVPGVRKFHGTKVLGLLAPGERMFHGTKVSRERKFSVWTFRSRERKCRETKSPDTIQSLSLHMRCMQLLDTLYTLSSVVDLCYNQVTVLFTKLYTSSRWMLLL